MNVVEAFVYRGTHALHRTSPPNHAMFLTINTKKETIPFSLSKRLCKHYNTFAYLDLIADALLGNKNPGSLLRRIFHSLSSCPSCTNTSTMVGSKN